VEPVPGQVGVPTDAHGGQQGAQLFFGDSGRKDLRAWVFGVDAVPHSGKSFVGQAFSGSQQPAPVGPFGVEFAGAPLPQVKLSEGCLESTRYWELAVSISSG